MSDTVAVWNARAGAYDVLCGRWPLFTEMADDLLDAVPGDARHLVDLAGGTGLVSARILAARPACRVTLVEPATAMIQRAQSHLGSQVSYVKATAVDLAGVTGPVDAVVCNAAMHLLDESPVFAAVSALLEPGGLFVFNLWWHSVAELSHDVDDRWWETVLADEIVAAGFRPPTEAPKSARRLRTRDGMTALAARHGFETCVFESGAVEATRELFVDFWEMNDAWLSDLGPAKKEVVARIRARCTGAVSLPFLRVVAQRRRRAD